MLVVHVDDVVTLEVQGCHLRSRNFTIGRVSVRIHPSLYVRLTRVGSGRTNTTRHDEVKVRLTVLLPANSNEARRRPRSPSNHLRSRSLTIQNLFDVIFRITSVSILQDAHVVVVPCRRAGVEHVLCIQWNTHRVLRNVRVSGIPDGLPPGSRLSRKLETLQFGLTVAIPRFRLTANPLRFLNQGEAQ